MMCLLCNVIMLLRSIISFLAVNNFVQNVNTPSSLSGNHVNFDNSVTAQWK
jgi:hypothetical protein